jgi:D-sedoheptulose 7-phosphate isomerase
MMMIPKTIRLNANLIALFKFANKNTILDDIYRTMSAFVTEEQFKNLYNKNDLLIIISSSGKSKNIEKLVNYANKKNVETIGLSGFDGGVLRKKSKIKIHVNSNNYGIIEDVHHILLHSLYQSIKVSLFKSKKKIRL